MWFINQFRRGWRWWLRHCDRPIAFKKTLWFTIFAAVLTFFMGRYYPPEEFRRLLNTITDLQENAAQLTQQQESNQQELIQLRVSLVVNDKVLHQLQARNAALVMENTHRREEAEFFRRILGSQSQDEVNIYALEDTPDFRPDHRRLSAVLVRGQAKKPFTGAYYFEVVERDPNNTRRVTRSPASINAALAFDAYLEIEQLIKLPPETTIEKLRLVIVDKKNKIIAEHSSEKNIAAHDE